MTAIRFLLGTAAGLGIGMAVGWSLSLGTPMLQDPVRLPDHASTAQPSALAPLRFPEALPEVLSAFLPDRPVVATTASRDFAALLRNFLCHAVALDVKVLVFALDAETYAQARDAGVAAILDERRAGDVGAVGTWNSASYNQVVYAKTRHQLSVLEFGRDLLFSDVDIPFTSDFASKLAALVSKENVDSVFQLNWPFGDLNVGFFFARSTPATLQLWRLLDRFEQTVSAGKMHNGTGLKEVDDQTLFMWLLFCGTPAGELPATVTEQYRQWLTRSQKKHKSGWGKGKGGQEEGIRIFDAKCAGTGVALRYGVLPPTLYLTGHRKWGKQQLERVKSDQSVLYHANFLKGMDAKVEAFKARGRWMECSFTLNKLKHPGFPTKVERRVTASG